MKINRKYFSILQIIALAIITGSFIGCDVDSEDPVTPKTLQQYKADLSAIVTPEKVAVQNCVLGYNKGNFKVKAEEFYIEYTTAYMDALVSAENVLADPNATIADVMDANYALSDPGKSFNDNVFLTDRRELQELIVYCDTLRAHTPEGTEVGQCPPEPRNNFIAAISTAKGWRDRHTTLDRQVTEAIDELNLELVIFEEAIIK